MKILLSLSIIFSSSLNSKAQSGVYYPFPDSNATWNWHFLNWHCTPWSPVDEEYSYTIDGDTLINSVSYNKLFTPFVQANNNGCGQLNSDGYVGCIRHDSIDRKVYCILPNDSTEYLIFDFNLQIGHTIPSLPFNCSVMYYVTHIDSVLIGSGYRKRWNSGNFYIIEGIGASSEFLKPVCGIIDGASGMLTCFTQDGTSLFPDTSTNCRLITKMNDTTIDEPVVNLFPNPFHSSMTINLSVENAIMTLYNSRGEQVWEVEINNFTTVLHRNSLVEGIYFYRLKIYSDKIVSGKIVVDE